MTTEEQIKELKTTLEKNKNMSEYIRGYYDGKSVVMAEWAKFEKMSDAGKTGWAMAQLLPKKSKSLTQPL